MQWRNVGSSTKNLFTYKTDTPFEIVFLRRPSNGCAVLAGIRRHDDVVYQPRMHDLRYTFAVHRIANWLKQGADLKSFAAGLSGIYGSGRTRLDRTLSHFDSERFSKQLSKLSPQCQKEKMA